MRKCNAEDVLDTGQWAMLNFSYPLVLTTREMLGFGVSATCILCVKKKRPSHKYTLQGALLLGVVLSTALPVLHGLSRESGGRVQELGGKYYLGTAIASISGVIILIVSDQKNDAVIHVRNLW